MKDKDTLHNRGICVVIPTYNNAGTLAQVVADAMAYCADVIVVNDGCTDGTAQILGQIEGVTTVTHEVNRGKGHALRSGFQKALEMGFAYAISMDADGQHYASDIPLFLEANQKWPGALIVGSRDLKGVDRSAGSNFANKFSNFWFWVQTGRNLPDTQTGFRLYPLKKLWGLSLLTSRYEAELELMVFASWHGVQLRDIPIHVYYPPREERVSHFRPGADFARISVLNTVLCGLAILYGLPCRLFRLIMRFVRTAYTIVFFVFFSLFVFKPGVWLFLKLTRSPERRRQGLHKLIYHSSRFVMLHHGIPGARFAYHIAEGTNFERPSVIICNHQSHLDLMCQLVFTPKIIFLTNNWVWNSPFFGYLIRNAAYYPVADGIDNLLPKLKELVDKGYHIAVYPEGTRSTNCEIGRFHQGAFYIAEQLGLDILPMCLYGPGKVLPKKSYLMKPGRLYIDVGKRMSQCELAGYGDIKAQASAIRKLMKQHYYELCNTLEKDA